jgi:hypothetical protein
VSQQSEPSAAAPDGREASPVLAVLPPAIILVGSAAYAWSLTGVPNPEMNLLLLRPLLAAIWLLLLLVVVREVLPAFRRSGAPTSDAISAVQAARFQPGTEGAAGLVVAATFVFSLVGVGGGAPRYLASLFAYLSVTGYLLGDRQLPMLTFRAALCAVGLYLVMGLVLGVRL